MKEVVDKMEKLAGLFPGGDTPIHEYEDNDSAEEENEEDDDDDTIETFGPQTCECQTVFINLFFFSFTRVF